MKKDRILMFFLLAIIVIYFSQGLLYTQGSIISQLSLLFILLVSVKYLIITLFDRNKKPMFYNVFTALLVLNVISYIFTADLSSSLQFGKFKGLLIVTLPFYSFYYLAEKDILKAKHFQVFFLIVLPIVVFQFYLERASILSERTWASENVVNNVAYIFVFLIPYLFLFKEKKIISIVGSLILMFFIIQGAKRGALITGLIGLALFGYYQFKTIDSKHRFKGYVFTFIVISIMVYYGYSFYINNEYLINRMSSISDGGFSGRDFIYRNIFNSWYYNQNFMKTLFGFGFGSALKLSGTGNWAHNDWLEGLACLGFIGVVMYALLFIGLFKLIFSKDISSDKKIAIMTIAVIWFITSLVSMNYYNATNSIYQNIVLAFLIGSKKTSIE